MHSRNAPLLPCSRADIIAIVEKSTFLHERFRPEFLPKHGDQLQDEPVELLNEWKKRVADGDDERFQKRLAWDGLNVFKVQERIAGVRLKHPDDLPYWACILEEILNTSQSRSDWTLDALESSLPILGAGAPPFAHIMAGFLEYATRQVKNYSAGGWDLLRPAARNSLQGQLLRRLSSFAQETLMIEFEVFRTLKGTAWGFLTRQIETADGNMSRSLYSRFVQSLLSQGLTLLFREYPVLARMLAQLTSQWTDATCEFLQRLCADQHEIASVLYETTSLSPVANIIADLSDPHDGGRTVLEVHFEDGYSCIYKPRNVDCESAYYELLTWFNSRGLPLPFATFRGVYRSNYGWVETVHGGSCADLAAVERYYFRAGMLLGLIFILEGCDCHAENLISKNEFPVLIDMEALFQPRVTAADLGAQADATSLAGQVFFSDSVFRVGLLPRWVSRHGRTYNIGGLAVAAQEQPRAQARCLKMINTDSMGWRNAGLSMDDSETCLSSPLAPGPQGYVDQIVDGFQSMYTCFQAHGTEILDSDRGCLARFANLSSRFLFRSTATYVNLQQASFRPMFLRDGMRVSIHLDGLCKRFLAADKPPEAWKIMKAEQEALLTGDVPLLLAGISDGIIRCGPARTEQCQLPPALETVHSHIRSLSHQELQLQSAYIRSAFQQAPIDKTHTAAENFSSLAPLENDLTAADFLSEALHIAAKIRTTAIASNGTATWITRAYDPDAQVWQMQPMMMRLYDGVCGPALFLAAIEHVAPGSGFRKLSLAAYRTVLEGLTRGIAQLSGGELGAGLGVGSVVYSLVTGGLLLEVEQLIDGAAHAARLLSVDRIRADTSFDLLRGSAGVVVCLSSLYRIRPEDWILDIMIACGDHLLNRRRTAHRGGAAWGTINGKMLCGFSHGAAGIALALCQLAEHTGDSRYSAAALAAEDYEDSWFSQDAGNWPDLLADDTSSYQFRNAWCHGAAGIILGRLNRPGAGGPNRFVEQGLQTVLQEPLRNLDHLCCGNLGRSDILLEAGRRLSRLHLVAEARKLASRVVNRRRRQDHYQLGVPLGIDLASFHQGLAGIGYNLLRLASREVIPCVLAWS